MYGLQMGSWGWWSLSPSMWSQGPWRWRRRLCLAEERSKLIFTFHAPREGLCGHTHLHFITRTGAQGFPSGLQAGKRPPGDVRSSLGENPGAAGRARSLSPAFLVAWTSPCVFELEVGQGSQAQDVKFWEHSSNLFLLAILFLMFWCDIDNVCV